MIFPRDNRVEHYLPQLEGAVAQVLATPQCGADFVEHELLIQQGGGITKPLDEDMEQFLYTLEGEVELALGSQAHTMRQGSFCWLPPHQAYQLMNKSDVQSRVIWIRRRYNPVEGIAVPSPFVAHESDVPARPTDTYMEQHLTPYEELSFDMGINLQRFDPGVCFSFVEAHVMEHGIYMVAGHGIYWLNQDFHEVQKDDFIYIAPYCPQFYYSTGWEKSAYLLYKDVNRDYTRFL